MGFFSWLTSDTKESIRNQHTGECRTVYLYCPDGTVLEEMAYDGYGTFGGQCAYDLLAQWNVPEEHAQLKDGLAKSHLGIELNFKRPEKIKFPLKFSFRGDLRYEDLAPAERCPNQGYFTEEVWKKISS